MSYSRNFGFRSFENIVRNGRFRAPATGTPILMWFKNTAAKTLYDGRVIPAAALVPASGIAVGDGLTPDGAGKFKKATVGTDPVWLVIEQINATTGLVEARLTF
jgi:hypothetical protein